MPFQEPNPLNKCHKAFLIKVIKRKVLNKVCKKIATCFVSQNKDKAERLKQFDRLEQTCTYCLVKG